MSATAYIRPRDLDEALAIRATHPDAMLLAGGTDLMVNANHKPVPSTIIDLWRLPGLGGITASAANVTIGAGSTFYEIETHPAILKSWPTLAAAAREIGALQIQARGTIGGNIGTSSPVGDSLPVLLALDAEIELGSVNGRRRVPYSTFCTGYRKTIMKPDELILSVTLKAPTKTTRTAWRKVGTRRAQSISKVMGAAWIEFEAGVVRSARIALGAVADRPIRVAAVEDNVKGLTPAAAAEAARYALRTAIRPIDDVRSTKDYRRTVAENLVARFFSGILS